MSLAIPNGATAITGFDWPGVEVEMSRRGIPVTPETRQAATMMDWDTLAATYAGTGPTAGALMMPGPNYSLGSAIGGALKGFVATGGNPLGAVGGGLLGAFTGTPTKPGGLSGGVGGTVIPGIVGGALGGIGGGIPGIVGGGISGMLPGLVSGLLPKSATSSSGCGCSSNGRRDPCTHQVITGGNAPRASFFGGCCPPGRVLKRVGMGRDVCMRKPRMNVYNPDALRRADRRLAGFTRGSSKILKRMGYTVSARKPSALKKHKKRR